MNKMYDIKLPLSIYIQMISYMIITLLMLKLLFISNSIVLVVILLLCILLQVGAIIVLMTKILRNTNELIITKNEIKINRKKVSIKEIEKIIIQGYFVQSIGIKRYGNKFISTGLHFRFRNNEETVIKELKQWATLNGIEVTNGKIYRWI